MNKVQDLIEQLRGLIPPVDAIFAVELLVMCIWILLLDSPKMSIPKSHKTVIMTTAFLAVMARVGYGIDHTDVLVGAIYIILIGVFMVLGSLMLILRSITLGKIKS
jgi:hypothetical protein